MSLLTPPHAETIDTTFGRHIGVKEKDARRLAWLASQVPEDGVIVEIGSFWGRSAGYMASAMPVGAHLYCIDLWTNPVDFNKFKSNIERIGMRERVTQIQGDSFKAAEAWTLPIDLLFIDATHTYAWVRNDYHNFAPHLKHGGLIAFHDYGARTWPDVKHFVDETVKIDVDELGVHQLVWSGKKR